MKPLIIILGPTAAGKTDLAAALAKKICGEIINADPWQTYRGLDIGTAKPPLRKEKGGFFYKGVRHHLFDITSPKTLMTVQRWKKLALRAIQDIHDREKIPVVIGGTRLYIAALAENLDIPEVPRQPHLRKKYEARIKKIGLERVAAELLKKDPGAASVVDLKNPRRVIRALEVIEATGKPFSVQRKRGPGLFNILFIGVRLPIKTLEARIKKRARSYLTKGLEKEARDLASRYGWSVSALQATSYREWRDYFKGNAATNDVLKNISLHTIQLAKRQMRWWKHDQRIHWVKSTEQAAKIASRFLRRHGISNRAAYQVPQKRRG